jgi:hypothetical protein
MYSTNRLLYISEIELKIIPVIIPVIILSSNIHISLDGIDLESGINTTNPGMNITMVIHASLVYSLAFLLCKNLVSAFISILIKIIYVNIKIPENSIIVFWYFN